MLSKVIPSGFLLTVIVCVVQCNGEKVFELKSNSADVPVRNIAGTRNRVKRGISGSTLTYAERVEFLSKHNEFRGIVNPSATDMKFMVSIHQRWKSSGQSTKLYYLKVLYASGEQNECFE